VTLLPILTRLGAYLSEGILAVQPVDAMMLAASVPSNIGLMTFILNFLLSWNILKNLYAI